MDRLDQPRTDQPGADPVAGGRSGPVGGGVTLAIADLVGGELGRAEARCSAVLDSTNHDTGSVADRRIARGVLAVIAYLCGDFSLACRLGERAIGHREQGTPPERIGADRTVDALAVPALFLAHRATGADDLADSVLAANPLPNRHRAALENLIDDVTREPLGSIAGGDDEQSQPSDLAIGAAAAALIAHGRTGDGIGVAPSGYSGPGSPDHSAAGRTARRSGLETWLGTLVAATAAGHRVSASVPVSVERAQAAGLASRGDLQRAAALLEVAEHRWRGQHAYTELAEVLVLQAEIVEKLGDRQDAEERAAEGYGLADRLGLLPTRARALALHHPSPRGLDLGSPDERSVLVSDVVGSTRVSTTVGDEAYFDLIMTHHGVVRPLLERHGGVEFSEGGDSLLAWFESPEDALDCALEILEAAAAHRRAGSVLRVRVAVAGGRPYFRNGRPYGSAVHLANRLLPKGEPDQIVVDEVTLARLGPVVRAFTSRTIELEGFGTKAIGFLAPDPST